MNEKIEYHFEVEGPGTVAVRFRDGGGRNIPTKAGDQVTLSEVVTAGKPLDEIAAKGNCCEAPPQASRQALQARIVELKAELDCDQQTLTNAHAELSKSGVPIGTLAERIRAFCARAEQARADVTSRAEVYGDSVDASHAYLTELGVPKNGDVKRRIETLLSSLDAASLRQRNELQAEALLAVARALGDQSPKETIRCESLVPKILHLRSALKEKEAHIRTYTATNEWQADRIKALAEKGTELKACNDNQSETIKRLWDRRDETKALLEYMLGYGGILPHTRFKIQTALSILNQP